MPTRPHDEKPARQIGPWLTLIGVAVLVGGVYLGLRSVDATIASAGIIILLVPLVALGAFILGIVGILVGSSGLREGRGRVGKIDWSGHEDDR